jgi:hypothetical protein
MKVSFCTRLFDIVPQQALQRVLRIPSCNYWILLFYSLHIRYSVRDILKHKSILRNAFPIDSIVRVITIVIT